MHVSTRAVPAKHSGGHDIDNVQCSSMIMLAQDNARMSPDAFRWDAQ
jgi:hypothetical protein